MVKIYKQPFAHGGDAIAIPDVSQPDGKMSNEDGWTVDYQLPSGDPNYKPVDRQEMNGVFKEVTEALGQVQIQGAATWSADGAPYPISAQVYHNGKQWLALRANSIVPAEGDDWTELVGKKYIDAIFPDLVEYLQPAITGTSTTNGTTDNTLVLTGIVPALALEVGDVIQITGSTGGLNDKLFTVESITDANSIIVNYEHAGNRGNGSLKLADQAANVTITRIAKWYNSGLYLGRDWVELTTLRSSGVTYFNMSRRSMAVSIVNGGNTVVEVLSGGVRVSRMTTGAGETSGGVSVVDLTYSATAISGTINAWAEMR